MQDDKDKHFERSRNRFKPVERKRPGKTEEREISQASSEVREEISIHEEFVTSSATTERQRIYSNVSKSSQETLRKIIAVKADDLTQLLKDKAFRQ
jgi:hypothetical protein